MFTKITSWQAEKYIPCAPLSGDRTSLPAGSLPDWPRDSGEEPRYSGGRMFPKSSKGHPATS